MNIWSRLGISVALAAMFCIAAAELLQPTQFYEQHKLVVIVSSVIAGGFLLGVGLWVNQRIKARYAASQAAMAEQDRDTDSRAWEPFLLFNMAYWGVMVVVFGCILVFLVPTYTKRSKPKVEARTPQPASKKPAAAPPPPVTNAVVQTNAPLQIPRFKLQGITIRAATRSALIDGRTYFAGDYVQDAKVTSIETNTVLLEWRGVNVVLQAPR
jgi:hypothetical protein